MRLAVTIPELADAFAWSEAYIRRRMKGRTLPFVRLGDQQLRSSTRVLLGDHLVLATPDDPDPFDVLVDDGIAAVHAFVEPADELSRKQLAGLLAVSPRTLQRAGMPPRLRGPEAASWLLARRTAARWESETWEAA